MAELPGAKKRRAVQGSAQADTVKSEKEKMPPDGADSASARAAPTPASAADRAEQHLTPPVAVE
jgi:hypothetical protein